MISLSVILLFLLGIFFYIFKKNLIFLAFPIVLALIIGITFKIMNGFFPLPNGMRHLFHLFSPPKDLYEPIIKDKFSFYEKGYTKMYSFCAKYLDFYDCGFTISADFPDNYKFTGKLKFELYFKDKLLFEKVATNWDTMGRKDVSLVHFE